MHGGTNPGAPKGNRNAWKHGARSGQMRAIARYIRLSRPIIDLAAISLAGGSALTGGRAADHPLRAELRLLDRLVEGDAEAVLVGPADHAAHRRAVAEIERHALAGAEARN